MAGRVTESRAEDDSLSGNTKLSTRTGNQEVFTVDRLNSPVLLRVVWPFAPGKYERHRTAGRKVPLEVS